MSSSAALNALLSLGSSVPPNSGTVGRSSEEDSGAGQPFSQFLGEFGGQSIGQSFQSPGAAGRTPMSGLMARGRRGLEAQ